MNRITLEKTYIKTIDWFDGRIVDWNSAGTAYSLDGTTEILQKYHFGFRCDASITSEDGVYAFIYQKLGTKGLLLKNGEVLREINRSYYQSAVYEFPAAFLNFKGKTYLIHCPFEYCRLDFEDVETGEIVTHIPNRESHDIFHSRLEVSPDHKYLMSKGWVWHPLDVIELFDVEQCFANPNLLDKGKCPSDVSSEICSASFIDNEQILICTSNEEQMNDEDEEPIAPSQIAIWKFKIDEICNPANVNSPFGNIFSIDEKYCWDLYDYPKIINISTGEVVDEIKDISSGKQGSSIIHHLDDLPQIAFNRKTKQIAIAGGDKIEVLSKL